MKPLQSDRRIIRPRLSYTIDHTLTPLSPQNTKHVINNIKNSPATGPDSIINFHLKHLGPQGIQALTNISNYTYVHCLIPNIWKQGRIITILKPNKDPTTPSSYRPITLLCTPSKITDRLILNIIHPDVPLSPTQHGFRPLHSANSLLTNLTQHVLDGINSKIPAQRTQRTLYISKAFDAIPRHRLTDKLYNTNMHNNTKRWLANYLGGRQSHVPFNGKSSHTRNFPNGVRNALFCPPTLFNIYMHDTPPTAANINIISYADDFTITSTHNDIPTAAAQLQSYLNTLQTWFDTNRLKVAPTKSTITLLTNYTKEHRHTPQLTLDNTTIPHKHSTKIPGVTYDTSLSFKDNVHNIKQICTYRLNTLLTLTGTYFGQHKETLTLIYKQFIRSVLEYASPA